jgi:hypothetical protein
MRRPALAMLCGVLLLGACSSSSKSSEGPTTTTTATTVLSPKADFVTQANNVCTDYNSKVEDAAANVSADTPQAQQVDLLQTKIIPLMRQEVTDLRNLKPPAGDENEVAAIFNALSTGLDNASNELKTNPKHALSTSYDPFAQADKLASTYGLTDCTSSSSS